MTKDSRFRINIQIRDTPMEEQSNQCPICIEPIESNADCCTTLCNNTFHTSCLVKASKALQTCPMCRASLVSSNNNGPKYVIQHIILTIKDAYRLDMLSHFTYRSHTNLKSALANLFTRNDITEIVEYLTAYVAQLSQTVSYVVSVEFDMSRNIVLPILAGMFSDSIQYPSFIPNEYLIHTLYGLLSKYDTKQLLNNLNNIQIVDEHQLPNFHPLD